MFLSKYEIVFCYHPTMFFLLKYPNYITTYSVRKKFSPKLTKVEFLRNRVFLFFLVEKVCLFYCFLYICFDRHLKNFNAENKLSSLSDK